MSLATQETDIILRTADDFYAYVQSNSHLPTFEHAKQWTAGTLQNFGINVSRRHRRAIAKHLPDEMKAELNQIFAPLMWRDMNLSAEEFCKTVARRSRASTDPQFAMLPVQAIFGGLKKMVGDDLAEKVRDDLSPELSKLWESA